MKTKQEIIENWLPRYTGTRLEDFGKHILLTNFQSYMDLVRYHPRDENCRHECGHGHGQFGLDRRLEQSAPVRTWHPP